MRNQQQGRTIQTFAVQKNVENLLASDSYVLTIFKVGIIGGSGSSSFEIIRDLVEKLPVMVAPK